MATLSATQNPGSLPGQPTSIATVDPKELTNLILQLINPDLVCNSYYHFYFY
jgi:hypothetical protein